MHAPSVTPANAGVHAHVIAIAFTRASRIALLLASIAACREVPAAGVPLTADQRVTLESLRLVDGHPLYTMHFQGSYRDRASAMATLPALPWACSLFAALGDPDEMAYGRNFDWDHSPAVLLFTNPPDGYASVSMVDIAYLGFAGTGSWGLTDRPLAERVGLLDAPLIPFDGMNQHGLVVGMAAVPASQPSRDPTRPTVDSLRVIREMLDRARDVEEAVAIIRGYNVDWGGGPPVHYLLADASGAAVLVEYQNGEMLTIHNDSHWHLATNHLRNTASGDGGCWRYANLAAALSAAGGRLTPEVAMGLLAGVSQPSTQWSIVYGITSGAVEVAMGRHYESAHSFRLDHARPH